MTRNGFVAVTILLACSGCYLAHERSPDAAVRVDAARGDAALAACNRPDVNRTTSVPAGVKEAAAITAPVVTPSAPPATAERGPIPPNANAEAPGTNASVALATPPDVPIAPGSKASIPGETDAAKAEDAAAVAPDTAAADAAKKSAPTPGSGAPTARSDSPTARDTAANNPRHGTLTAAEESTEMPKAGQVNNHSSTSLEKSSGR